MKEFLSQRGVTWAEKYVDEDRAAAIEMVRRSGQRGVPVTIIGDEVVVGFDRPRLERILASLKAAQASSDARNERKRRSLGAKVADANRYAMPGGAAVEGAYIGGVNPGSPAEAAGLGVGDVIISVAGRDVRSVDDLATALASSSGVDVSLTVARGKTRREVMVRFD